MKTCFEIGEKPKNQHPSVSGSMEKSSSHIKVEAVLSAKAASDRWQAGIHRCEKGIRAGQHW